MISIIIVNFNGRRFLGDCLSSIMGLDWPRDKIEVLMVDNASRDGSVRWVRRNFSEVKVIELDKNTGFARGCNVGAENAGGDLIALVNNDVRLERDWLRQMVSHFKDDVVCGGSRILDWDGNKIHYAGGMMNVQGIGKNLGEGKGVDMSFKGGDTLFACGGAMLIRRDVFLEVNGFDEDYFAFYEDVDLGWRLWIMGYRVIFVPEAVCYHHGGSSFRFVDKGLLRFLQIRNPICSILKNYEDGAVGKYLLCAILLSLKRTMLYLPGKWEVGSGKYLNIENTGYLRSDIKAKLISLLDRLRGDFTGQNKILEADLLAYQYILDNFSSILLKREGVQRARKRGDREIFHLFGEPFWMVEEDEGYRKFQDNLMDFLKI